ncbi:unnamed protein product, partial [Phaeothamnion confervicola]
DAAAAAVLERQRTADRLRHRQELHSRLVPAIVRVNRRSIQIGAPELLRKVALVMQSSARIVLSATTGTAEPPNEAGLTASVPGDNVDGPSRGVSSKWKALKHDREPPKDFVILKVSCALEGDAEMASESASLPPSLPSPARRCDIFEALEVSGLLPGCHYVVRLQMTSTARALLSEAAWATGMADAALALEKNKSAASSDAIGRITAEALQVLPGGSVNQELQEPAAAAALDQTLTKGAGVSMGERTFLDPSVEVTTLPDVPEPPPAVACRLVVSAAALDDGAPDAVGTLQAWHSPYASISPPRHGPLHAFTSPSRQRQSPRRQGARQVLSPPVRHQHQQRHRLDDGGGGEANDGRAIGIGRTSAVGVVEAVVSLRWEAAEPNGSAIIEYVVERRLDRAGERWRTLDTTAITSFVDRPLRSLGEAALRELREGDLPLLYRVAAVNAIGRGAPAPCREDVLLRPFVRGPATESRRRAVAPGVVQASSSDKGENWPASITRDAAALLLARPMGRTGTAGFMDDYSKDGSCNETNSFDGEPKGLNLCPCCGSRDGLPLELTLSPLAAAATSAVSAAAPVEGCRIVEGMGKAGRVIEAAPLAGSVYHPVTLQKRLPGRKKGVGAGKGRRGNHHGS